MHFRFAAILQLTVSSVFSLECRCTYEQNIDQLLLQHGSAIVFASSTIYCYYVYYLLLRPEHPLSGRLVSDI